jgi:hypothetical protein
MEAIVVGKLSELVFNRYEVGSCDWEDRKSKNAIAPRSISPDDVYHSVSRRDRDVTLLACVSAGGDPLTAMIIMRSSAPDSLWSRPPRQHENAMVRCRQLADINENLFYEYIANAFVRYVCDIRRRREFTGETAVLLIDSASAHVSERVLRIIGENNILPLVFAAHKTNVFQALNLVPP